jgi:hypothetical protein
MVLAGSRMRFSTLSITLYSMPTGIAFSPKRPNWICVVSGENSAIELGKKDTDRRWDNNWLLGLIAADSFRLEPLQPTQEEPLLGRLVGEGECAFEGGARGAGATEPLEQVGPGCVGVGIVIKIAGRDHRIDRREPGFGPVAHSERRGFVKRHNR